MLFFQLLFITRAKKLIMNKMVRMEKEGLIWMFSKHMKTP